jgi:hypothetical protein
MDSILLSLVFWAKNLTGNIMFSAPSPSCAKYLGIQSGIRLSSQTAISDNELKFSICRFFVNRNFLHSFVLYQDHNIIFQETIYSSWTVQYKKARNPPIFSVFLVLEDWNNGRRNSPGKIQTAFTNCPAADFEFLFRCLGGLVLLIGSNKRRKVII